MTETNQEKKERRLALGRSYWFDFIVQVDALEQFDLLRVTSRAEGDCFGLAKIWGFTSDTLLGSAFNEVWRWHDARQTLFDMPVADADRLALRAAKFIADNWPDKRERRTLQRVVRYGGWLIKVYGVIRWKWLGGKE